MSYESSVKIYLEDTDAQGIVYHANYLKFFERARTDVLDNSGVGLSRAQQLGFRFVVHEMKIKFSRPAKLGETLAISTDVKRSSQFRVTFTQIAKRGSELVVRAEVDVVCIGANGDLVEITEAILPGVG
jgi:tol-pal system-associated acyl-CoA thioesterase